MVWNKKELVAEEVRNLAARYDLPSEIGSVDVRQLARTRKLSLETAAREARYGFFARVARRRRCHTIFLGHHADDLVETFLMNLFRGAGPAGLASLREESTRQVGAVQLKILRPLLPREGDRRLFSGSSPTSSPNMQNISFIRKWAAA